MERTHAILHGTVRHCHPRVMAPVGEPGLLHEMLDEASRQRGVLEESPGIGAVAPPCPLQLAHGGDPILDGDHGGAALGRDSVGHHGRRPVRRRREVEPGALLQLEGP
jgi:hypothetical protein